MIIFYNNITIFTATFDQFNASFAEFVTVYIRSDFLASIEVFYSNCYTDKIIYNKNICIKFETIMQSFSLLISDFWIPFYVIFNMLSMFL